MADSPAANGAVEGRGVGGGVVAEVAGDGVVGDLRRTAQLSTARGAPQSTRGERCGYSVMNPL